MASLAVPSTMSVPIRVWESGAVRVGERRVGLDVVLHEFNRGTEPAEIVEQHPTLALADVYGAIAFYLQNRGIVDDYLRAHDEEALRLEEEWRSRAASELAAPR